MKPIKIENEEIEKAICTGNTYIQVGNRKFLLFEIDQMMDPNGYEVTDPDEERQLLNALKGDNPVLDEEEISRILGEQK